LRSFVLFLLPFQFQQDNDVDGDFDVSDNESDDNGSEPEDEYIMETYEEGGADIESMEEGEAEEDEKEEAEQEEEQEECDEGTVTNPEHILKWEKFTMKIKDATGTVPNLQDYLKAKQKRQDAVDKLNSVMEVFVDELKGVAAGLVSETLIKIHRSQQSEVETNERDVMISFYTNDKRRKSMLKMMDRANSKWDKLYTSMTERIVNPVCSFWILKG
jgi:hypothetical protein